MKTNNLTVKYGISPDPSAKISVLINIDNKHNTNSYKVVPAVLERNIKTDNLLEKSQFMQSHEGCAQPHALTHSIVDVVFRRGDPCGRPLIFLRRPQGSPLRT